MAVPSDSGHHEPVGTQLRFQPRHHESPADRAGPDGTEQQAVEFRPAGNLAPRYERQQRPVGAGEQEEADRPNERGAQVRVVPRMARAREHGAHEALRGQAARACRWRAPPQQRSDDAQIADGVEPERRRDPGGGRDRPAERRAHGTAHVDTGAIRRHRGRQVRARNELRNDRLPGRGRERAAHAQEERKREQGDRRHRVDRHEGSERSPPAPSSRFRTPISRRRWSTMSASAPAGSANRNIGQARRHLNQRYGQRIRIETRHQPAGGGAVHPGADVRNDCGGPQDCEIGMTKRDQRRPGCAGGRCDWCIFRWSGHLIEIAACLKQRNTRPLQGRSSLCPP